MNHSMRKLPNYQPQVNEEEEETDQISVEEPQEPHSPRSETRKMALKIIFGLIVCLNLLGIIPLLKLFNNSRTKWDYLKQMEGPMSESIRHISANLKADPILDIQIIHSASSCPSGFEPLKLGDWAGTLAGYLCDNGDLLSSPCSQVGSEKCKTDLPSTDPIEMFTWEGSILCVKRAVLGIDYLKKIECPSDFKECYPGGCFKGDCPITNLEISSAGNAANKFNRSEKYLVSTKKQGELPLINIQITLGDTQSINSSSSVLLALHENQYGHDGTNLDTQTAFDSFTENSFPSSVMNLPHFEENAKSTTSVFSWTVRMKIQKKDQCLDFDEEFANDFINASRSMLNDLIPTIIAGAQIGFLVGLLALKACGPMNPLDKDETLSGFLAIHFISCIFFIGEIGFFSYLYQSFCNMREYVDRYDWLEFYEGGYSTGCFSPGNHVIHDYWDMFRGIETSFWPNFVLILLGILHILIFIAFFFVKKMPFRR